MFILGSVRFFFFLPIPLNAAFTPSLRVLPWLQECSLQLVQVHDPVGFDAFHVQGLWMDDKYVYFTSVRRLGLEGWIFKVDRKGAAETAKRNVAKGWDLHPGGIDYDGHRLWVPVAMYKKHSHTHVLSLDPETLTERLEFEVDDHIGALACHQGQVVGANWDAETFYFWNLEGTLLQKRGNPTGVAYQDIKAMDGYLACVGGEVLDWIKIDSWTLAKRYELKESSAQGHPMGREGVAILDDTVFFLPDDGPGCRLYEFQLQKNE